MTISSQSSSRRHASHGSNNLLDDFDSPYPISGTVSPATTGKLSPYALSLDGRTSGASSVDACSGNSIGKDKSLRILALNMFISTTEPQKLQPKTGKGTISSRFWQSLACSRPCIDDTGANLSEQKIQVTKKHGNASEEWERDHAWSFPWIPADLEKNNRKMKQKKGNLERTGKWATIKAFFTRKKKTGEQTPSSGNCSQNISLESMNPTETDEGDCASLTSEVSSVYLTADVSPTKEQQERSSRAKSVPENVGKIKVTDALRNPSRKGSALTRSFSKLPCRQADIDVNPLEKFPLLDPEEYATPVSWLSSPVSSNTATATTFQQRREQGHQSVSLKYNVESTERTRKSLVRHKERLNSPARSKRVSPHRDAPAVETDTRQLKFSGSLGNMTNSVAIAKQSSDPYQDFKESMLEMIRLKNLKEDEQLEDLLKCYLSLNGPQFHSLIIKVFAEVCPPY